MLRVSDLLNSIKTKSRGVHVEMGGVWSLGESVCRYVAGELSRGYLLERDAAMFSEKQRRVLTFMKTPRELEKVCTNAFI